MIYVWYFDNDDPSELKSGDRINKPPRLCHGEDLTPARFLSFHGLSVSVH